MGQFLLFRSVGFAIAVSAVLLALSVAVGLTCRGGGGFDNSGELVAPVSERQVTFQELISRPIALSAADKACLPTIPGVMEGHSVLGDGPIRTPVGGVVEIPPDQAGKERFLLKTLWVAVPGYDGPALIRGVRIDGPGTVEFMTSNQLASSGEMWFPAGATGTWGQGYGLNARYMPSYSVVEGAGCYALQVDGPDFSYVVVFKVQAS